MSHTPIYVTRSAMPELREYVAEIEDIWQTHTLTNMGPKHTALARALTEYLEVPALELFTNGHMALELSLQALNLQGEVITTPFTFASTTHAIVRNGLTPVFGDIDPVTFTLSPEAIEPLITDRTCAIMPVHVYGHLCDVEAIDRIARKHGLKVIYDAAHAFGERYRGRGVGAFGDVSCFSFHATKVFNTIEGGAASFSDAELGHALYRLKNFGIRGPEVVDGVGANAKMNEFCAAMGLCNLRRAAADIAARGAVTERYRAHLAGVEGLQLGCVQADVEPNYAYFPVVFDEKRFGASRNEVAEALERENIFPRKYFYPITSTFSCFHGRFDANRTPVALHISKRVLTLPLYPDLPLEEVDRICAIVLGCRKARGTCAP